MSYGVEGRYGLRSGIRTYKDTVQDPSWAKSVLVELYPGEPVTSWAVYSGNVYVGAARRSHDGVRLDVMGVSTLVGPLARSTAADPATLAAGEYWYDVDAEMGDATWDDGETRWDDGSTRWDTFVAIYVRLPDDSDPEDTEVEVEYFLAFANRAETHPVLGSNLVSNGTFETWTGSAFTGWTEASNVAKGGTVSLGAGTEPYQGDLTAQMTADGPVNSHSLAQSVTLVPGQAYRFSGAYKTTGNMAPSIQVGSGMASNGRDAALSSVIPLDETAEEGEWRRFTYDFVTPSGWGATDFVLYGTLYAYQGYASGTVEWDDVAVQPIYRWAAYAPRITAANVPTVSTASNDVFFGGKQVGAGGVALLNHDKFFETLSTLDWINRKCILKVGGRYLSDDGGVEGLGTEDYRTAFTGLIQNVQVDDTEFALDIQDVRAAYFRSVPSQSYTRADFPNVADADEGAPRPLWFGRKDGVRPIRYSMGTYYGLYEAADCTNAPNGIVEFTDVYSYAAAEAAAIRDADRRASLRYYREPITSVTTVGSGAAWGGTTAAYLARISAGPAWDAGGYADSQTIASTEYARVEGTNGYTAQDTAAQYHMLGLASSVLSTGSYTELDYAMYLVSLNTLEIYESGSLAYTATGITVQEGDRARIWMKNGTVEYWYNGRDTDGWTLIYTSLVTPSGSYYPAVSLYNAGTMCAGFAIYRSTDLAYTEDLANGRITLNTSPKVLEVTRENYRLSYYHSSTANRIAYMPKGTYLASEAAFLFGAAMAGSMFAGGVYATFADATQKITFASPSGSYIQSGSGDFTEGLKLLGFTQEDPAAASTSDEAESPVMEDEDLETWIRVDGQGFKDDASGTYTTVANGLIEVGADVFRALLVAFLKYDSDIIDEASFQSARERAPESVAVHLNKETPLKDIMETLEWTNVANISIGGDGTVYFDVYAADVPTGTVTLEDTDFKSFAVTWEAADVYRKVRTYYDEDPEGNFFLYRDSDNPDVEARFGRPEIKEFYTWLTFQDTAANNASRMSELAKTPAQQLRGTVMGKLLDHRVGQKVRVTRDRAAASGGLLSSSVYRIISIRQNHAMGLSQFIAVPDVVTVAGVACISTCQSYCEQVCQATCQTACQTTCQVDCQVGCQVACQSCDQTTCQEACELECQTTCQLACQAGCQLGCQTGCQVSCQTGCQVSCQTGCEVTCQTTCETACQTTCETSCQEYCESNCVTSCEYACQVTCEHYGQ